MPGNSWMSRRSSASARVTCTSRFSPRETATWPVSRATPAARTIGTDTFANCPLSQPSSGLSNETESG
ncbi:MAG: hypothetical protein BWZ10_03110 [candidate division BRC1 bacterium ADurb.BinA364]|nr:MAG: hypothetical protein BWZ10_03110 [candidate division BRC1 bacterium ADurb.BinA364]